MEEQDLFLRRVDDEWFRYYHLFAEFLRQRLERDDPSRVRELHLTASRWFADHRYVSDAVDHALAAGDEARAGEIVEQDGSSLLDHGQMATLLGLVGKLPRSMVATRPRLQLALAWSNIMLHRFAAAKHALEMVDKTLARITMDQQEIDDLRLEADVVRGVVELRSDRIGAIDRLVGPALERRDSIRPFLVSAAANVAAFAAVYRYDIEEVRRLRGSCGAVPHQRIGLQRDSRAVLPRAGREPATADRHRRGGISSRAEIWSTARWFAFVCGAARGLAAR